MAYILKAQQRRELNRKLEHLKCGNCRKYGLWFTRDLGVTCAVCGVERQDLLPE